MKTMQQNKLVVAGLAGLSLALAGSAFLSRAPKPTVANAAPAAVPANAIAPELVGASWLNTGGKPITLASRRGKVTIVEFWTFGCSNCQANLPAYARLSKKFAPQGVSIIGVHTPESDYERDPKNVAQSIKKWNIDYPVLLDNKNENWKRWNQQYWPTLYVLDKANRVRFKWAGELNYNNAGGEAKVTKVVEQLLQENAAPAASGAANRKANNAGIGKVIKTDDEWKKILTPQQFYVLRQEGTERAFAGDHDYHGPGTYRCAACDLELYDAKTMFDSGTGWPSFYQPLKGRVTQKTDADGSRNEVRCARCDGHLGHVFDDGPQPTGLRYCMNAVAMKFVKAEPKSK